MKSGIEKIDKSNMFDLLMKFPDLAEEGYNSSIKIKYSKPEKILIVGMGGSAIAGDILKNWFSDIPIQVCRNYYMPNWVDEKTLVIVISYSGNTEETLFSFREAIKKNVMIFGITSGGELEKLCQKFSVPYMILPKDIPPRNALPSIFFSLLSLLKRIIDKEEEIKETFEVLKKIRDRMKSKRNPVQKMAERIKDIPIVYTYTEFEGVAKRLKTQLNENSKVLSKYEVFPELSHNELVGWSKSYPATVILLRDLREPEKIRKRIEFTKRVLRGKTKIIELWSEGQSKLARMFSLLYKGDLLSFYLAIHRKVDPTPVKIIEKLKKFLKANPS